MALLIVALAACGEPDRSQDFGRVVLPPGQPLVIGVSAALTGDESGDAQRIERGVRLAVEQAGEVKGHPLTVAVWDDGCSAEGSIDAANAFTAMSDLAGVIGPMCSSGCVPASIVYDEAKTLMLTPSCTASVLTGQVLDTVVRLAWNGLEAAEGGARFARDELKARRVFAVNDSTFYGKQQRDAFETELEDRGGGLIADEYIEATDWDFTALVAQIKAARPDLIYFAGFLPAGRFLIQQLRYAGVTAPFMAADALLDADAFIRESNTAAEHAYVTDAVPVQGKRFEEFARAYREHWGEDPGPFAAQAYDAANVLIAAAKDVAGDDNGTLTLDKKALRDAVLDTDRQGATGRIRFFDNGERVPKDAVVAVIKQAEGDGFQTVKEYEAE
ncbi:MAG: branched-chain amino acid ABC transporter substrate-binding protein [Dehalococcoidia bacterium]